MSENYTNKPLRQRILLALPWWLAALSWTWLAVKLHQNREINGLAAAAIWMAALRFGWQIFFPRTTGTGLLTERIVPRNEDDGHTS